MRIAIVDDRADDRRRLCDSVCRWARKQRRADHAAARDI